MAQAMIYAASRNIISPLGIGVGENLDAVLSGKSMLANQGAKLGLPEDCHVSLFDREALVHSLLKDLIGEYSFFEALCIASVRGALAQNEELIGSASDKDTIFVVSSTKGNVEYLETDSHDARCYLGESAERIAKYFGNDNRPILVSNACISGVCAQIAAVRELLTGRFKRAIVVGCDVLSKFIVSGFQSFKALSVEDCRPYDKDRAGLNLGEAAATLVLVRSDEAVNGAWRYMASSIHNDANHISGPSRTGEGSYRVLHDILEKVEVEKIGVVNCHGTATAYNDEMESIAVHRAGLDNVPLNGLKGYYGHTLGAAGVMETILSMAALERGVIIGTRGYHQCGISYPLNISNQERSCDKKCFIKLLSGFGGTNAGIAYEYIEK